MTYTIPHYPGHLVDSIWAANGRRVTIRPMLPQDLKLQREFFRSLSPRARYSRFLSWFNELPDGVAQRLENFDNNSHFALLAEVFEDKREIMIGEARYIVDHDDSDTCEFALVVADHWQRRGIGGALLAQLERRAAACGLRRMRADTLYDNRAMRGLAASRGYAIRANREDARLVKLEKQMSSPAGLRNVQDFAA
ncbi:MAG: GNAT family N-acetyltransferase [Xanthobacteraceae bacterium]|jgi:acetyltransferase